MPEKNQKNVVKRTYHLPEKLMEEFSSWCFPGRDFSTKIAGAVYLYMRFGPKVREFCDKAAHKDAIQPPGSELAESLKEDIDRMNADLAAAEMVKKSEDDSLRQKQKKGRAASKSA